MTLEELEQLWEKDCKIDKSELDNEALKIPFLHGKYFKLYIKEKLLYEKKQTEFDQLYKTKLDYFWGRMNQEELQQRGWQRFDLKLAKPEIEVYIKADEDIIQNRMHLAARKAKIDFLESIIQSINNRSYLIGHSIEFLRWSQGSI